MNLSVIILTYNEQLHISRAIENVLPIAKDIFVVDSFSTDQTCEIARSLGAKVFQNKWENNHAKQFNWALNNLPITTKWVLRLDADEYLTDQLIEEVKEKLPTLEDDITGVILHREQDCFGKWVHPLELLRIFQYKKAICEQRWMDEHIQLLEGKTVVFAQTFRDHNLNTFGWWTDKHNGYSIREAVDLLDVELGLLQPVETQRATSLQIGAEATAKRNKKLRYARSPLFWRAFGYFVYRYVFKGGLFKGKQQFVWDFFQGLWYRMLVDVKIYEIKHACGNNKEKIIAFVKEKYNIDILTINMNKNLSVSENMLNTHTHTHTHTHTQPRA
ncbi:MAG: glycosyltransferase family 2 protein [Prevotellaceae bacterium]|jgi:glycosyltransferase involved in cell wall biosynthesis|nr:glycosyltransferase family 2 protein [Prevotellaceae bacterium]